MLTTKTVNNLFSQSKNPKIYVRPVEEKDLERLNELTKKCFPDNIQWYIDGIANKFWGTTYHSDATEMWLWESEGRLAAYCIVITDLKSWANDKSKMIKCSLISRLGTLFIKPGIITHKLKKKIRLYRYFIKNSKQSGKTKHENYPPETNDTIFYGGMNIDPCDILWVEKTAVSEEFRSTGIALTTVKFSEERALFHNRKEIFGVIEAHLTPWWMMHERFGWKRVNEVSGRFTYKKQLI